MPQPQQNNRQGARQNRTPNSTAILGKIQPQAIDMECAVLGAIMLEKDSFSKVSENLSKETFYDHKNELIYSAIQELAIEQKPIDMLTVVEQLKNNGTLEEAGGYVYIAELTSRVSSAAHVEYHANIIAKKYQQRQLISFGGEVVSKAFDETCDVDETMQFAEGELFKLSEKNLHNSVEQIDPTIDLALKKIQEAANRADGLSGLPSGFFDLDKITSGWQATDLIIIAARPAMGKTAFALSMVKNIGVDYQIPVGIFSLEMSKLQLVNRMLQNVCEITGDKVKSGRLEKEEWEQLTIKISQLRHAPIYVDDTSGLSIFELRTKARRLVRDHGVKVIMIDYLQLMTASGQNFGSREQEVSIISRSLKGLAKELGIPIIALSQLNRGVESRVGEGKRPQLSDLRESGAIEQDADMVCFIHRPEYYKMYEDEKGNDLRGLAEIIIAKHRNGAVGDIRLRFKGEFTRFSNIDDDTALVQRRYSYNDSGTTLSSRMNNEANTEAFLSNKSNEEEAPF
ncbi:MAG: replicative DNA helicase [Bacteroidales bacterium]|nr:replicative DNA helicase [Bacteroidales bacterium]